MAAAQPKSLLLVPVDDTDVSEKVVQYTLHDIYREGDEIRLFHIIPTPLPEYVAGGVDVIFSLEPDPQEDLKHIEEAKAFIRRRFVPTLDEAKVPYKVEIVHYLTGYRYDYLLSASTNEDSIGEAIVKRAERLKPRAVVLAKHQRGAIKEFFLGSAAKHVCRLCTFPVVLLHEEAQGGSSRRETAAGEAGRAHAA